MEHIEKKSSNIQELAEMIKSVISEGEITMSKYEKIMHQADMDGVVDTSEQKLLNQLHEMISNGSVKRIPG